MDERISRTAPPDDRSASIRQRADTLSVANQLCFAIYAVAHSFNRAYKSLLQPLGLTYPQYLVMLVLWEQDDLTVGDIGERLNLDSGTLTPLLKRLESYGLVTRVRDMRDERQVRISLTAPGQDLRVRASEVPAQMTCASGLPYEELVAIREKLKALRRNLDDNA